MELHGGAERLVAVAEDVGAHPDGVAGTALDRPSAAIDLRLNGRDTDPGRGRGGQGGRLAHAEDRTIRLCR